MNRPDRGEEEDAGDGMWSRGQVNGDREYVLAVDLDGDGKPDFEVPGIHQVARGEELVGEDGASASVVVVREVSGDDDAIPVGDVGGGAGGGGLVL